MKLGTSAPSYVCFCAIVGIAAAVNAQVQPRSQDEIDRIQREYSEQLRHSKLVGPDDGLAIEFPNGEMIPLGRERGCQPPVTKGGLILVDCTAFDGPAYYFDASTRAMFEACSVWFPDPMRCPPKQWPVEVPGCDALELSGLADTGNPSARSRDSQGIAGAWRLYAIPVAGPLAGGFIGVEGGWTMTLADESITFGFGSAGVERSYAVVEQDGQRYSLEIRDDRSARTLVVLELAPCGLFVESEGTCDEFCENVDEELGPPSEEQIRDMARQMTDSGTFATVEQAIEAIREIEGGPPPPIFDKRALFIAEAR